MEDPNDDTSLAARLLDENQQLREELRDLREDFEHALHHLNRLKEAAREGQ